MSINTQSINTQSIAGTRDFPPNKFIFREWLFNKMRQCARSSGFFEYDAPVLEYQELWTRKGGDDILTEMYAFTDKDGQKICLRPEMTPSVTRLILQNPKLILPARWFSIPQCWRFEDTSSARKREHYQWNVDIFGGKRVHSEGELLDVMINFLKSVGLTSKDIVIHVSNRQILGKVMTKLGVSDELFPRACNIVDKLNKKTKEELVEMLNTEIGIKKEECEMIFDVMKEKTLEGVKKFLGENDETVKEMEAIFALAKNYGYDDWLEFDASIVRGLSYYTDIVFEGFLTNCSIKRAVCGGGRYDDLMLTYGHNKRIPAIGFGFGDVVILEALTELKLLPDLTPHVDSIVVAYNEKLYEGAVKVAQLLRKKGERVEIYTKTDGKLGSAYSYADRVGAECVYLIAPDEWNAGNVVRKRLRDGQNDSKQENIKLTDL